MIFSSQVDAKQYNKAQYLITDIKNEGALRTARRLGTPFIGELPNNSKIIVPSKHVKENNLVGIVVNHHMFHEPLPEETESYFPIGNTSIITSIVDKLYDNGSEIEEVGYSSNTKYSQFFGWVRVADKYNDPSYRPAVAFRNSYDKSSRFAMAVGLNVNLCSNLSFSRYTVMTKHTSNQGADFENYIGQVVGKVDTRYKEEVNRLEVLKEHDMTKHSMYELIGSFLYEQEVINVTQCNALVRELKNQTLWKADTYFDLYMHITEVLKTTPPSLAMEAYNKSYSAIASYIGLEEHLN